MKILVCVFCQVPDHRKFAAGARCLPVTIRRTSTPREKFAAMKLAIERLAVMMVRLRFPGKAACHLHRRRAHVQGNAIPSNTISAALDPIACFASTACVERMAYGGS